MNGISGIGSNISIMQSMSGLNRPDPAATAQNLFSALDESGQGYLEKTDLQAAFEKVTSTSSSSSVYSDDSDIDELFSQLDTDGDGKITEQEFTDSLAKIDAQINNIFSNMRMNQAMGDMPPPPPGDMPPPPGNMDGAGDEGFTLEELSSQLEEIGSSDSARSSLISNIIDNFDEADVNGDGKVNLAEALNFDQNSSTSSEVSGSAATSGTDNDLNAKVMLQIMRLVQAYSLDSATENTTSSNLSVSA